MKTQQGLLASDILEIFRQNFDYEIVDTPLGKAVKMPSREAFIFSTVSGAAYYNSKTLVSTAKGLTKLFYNAFDYNFVGGIFNNSSLCNTPLYMQNDRGFYFNSDFKYIVPVEFDGEVNLQRYIKRCIPECNPDFLILRVDLSKKGHGLENFMEYLAAEYFKRLGFIVENQIPLAHAIGSPDFGGYDLSEIHDAVSEYLPSGFHIIELAMLRLNQPIHHYDCTNQNSNKLIVGEAKTSTTIMDKQLRKYLNTGLFDFGVEIHPSKQDATFLDRGIFTIDSDHKVVYKSAATIYNVPSNIQQLDKQEYRDWLINYMKFYLLANFTNDELTAFYVKKNGRCFDSLQDLVSFVKAIKASDIVEELKKLAYGTI